MYTRKKLTDGEELDLFSPAFGLLYLSWRCTGRRCGGGGMKVGLKAVIIGQSPLLAMLIERAVWLSRYRLSHSHLHRSKALITRVCHGCWGLSVHLYPDMTAESSPGWSVDGLIGLQRTTSTERKIRQKMVSKAGVRVFRVDRRMEMWQCFGNARGDKKSNIIQRQNVIFTLSWTF